MSWRTWFAVLAFAFTVAGCDDDADKRTAADAGAPDAGIDPALMDPNIADALKSARPLASGGPAIPGDGPPPNGIFAPGGADKAHAKGAPIKITLLEKGSEPRAKLRPKLALEGKKTLALQVGKRFHQQLLPNVDYVLDVQMEGNKGPTEGAAEPAPQPAGKPTIKFTVAKAKSSQRQMGQLPPDIDEKLGGLKGTVIKATLEPDGSLSNERIELGKDTSKALVELVNALQEILTLLFSPWPDEPVGKGAFWLAGDRATVGGMDVVRYRHTTLEDVQGDELAISVNVRLYSAVPGQLPGAIGPQQGVTVLGFESFGKGVFTRKTSELLPLSGQLKVPMVLQVTDNPQQAQQRSMDLTIESAASILGPAKKEGAPPDPGAPPAPAPQPPPP